MNQEVDIAIWLNTHKEGLEDKIRKNSNPFYYMFPDSLYEIYLETYANRAVDIIKKEIECSFYLNPEEINSIITKHFINRVLGQNFLTPEKRN